DSPVDVLVGVRERGEQALELRRRHVDTRREQMPEEGAEPLGVTRSGVLVARDGAVVAEERQQATDPLDDAERREALLEPGAEPRELHLAGTVPTPPHH